MLFGRAPVLEIDGTKIAGSMNILRHLGAKFGMAGEDDVADALMFLLGSSSGMELKVMRRINWYKNSKIRLFHKCLKRWKNVTNSHVNGLELCCYCILCLLYRLFLINY